MLVNFSGIYLSNYKEKVEIFPNTTRTLSNCKEKVEICPNTTRTLSSITSKKQNFASKLDAK